MPDQAHPDWALKERTQADLAAFIEAGVALNGYDSSGWLPALDIPAAVLVTRRDKIVAPWRQEAMAALIRGSKRYRDRRRARRRGDQPDHVPPCAAGGLRRARRLTEGGRDLLGRRHDQRRIALCRSPSWCVPPAGNRHRGHHGPVQEHSAR